MTQTFVSKNPNYFYYEFTNTPEGDVANLRILNEGDDNITVNKVLCTFVKKGTTYLDMISEIN